MRHAEFVSSEKMLTGKAAAITASVVTENDVSRKDTSIFKRKIKSNETKEMRVITNSVKQKKHSFELETASYRNLNQVF